MHWEELVALVCGYIMKIVMLQRSRSSLPKVVKKISLRNSKGPQRHLFIPLFCLDYHRGIKRDDYLHSAMVLGIGYLCHWPGGFCLLPLSGTLAELRVPAGQEAPQVPRSQFLMWLPENVLIASLVALLHLCWICSRNHHKPLLCFSDGHVSGRSRFL